jgi:hypothetical protein
MQATDAVQHYSEIDVVLSGLVTGIMALGAIVGFFMKERFKRYDAHLIQAALEDQKLALLQQAVTAHAAEDDKRFTDLKDSLAYNTKTTTWVGDCVIAMRTGDPIPPRPQQFP